ncbi:heterokaryon incompatibility protein-domain-containing protein [Xylariales sp. PMI_506]|nr:heterokaryon incompatibility protein-domain-containing protein [Xylariales sp. PMI_506]
MDPFIYSPLENTDSIRLVRILPADVAAPLSVEVFHTNLAHREPYECLSYAWGQPDQAYAITVTPSHDSSEKRTSLLVSTNLHDALLYLRGRELSRLFWIDAICIDQKNTTERGRQVGIMRTIYSGASRVVVWVGKESQTSQRALHFLTEMGTSMMEELQGSSYKVAVPGLAWEDTPIISKWDSWQARQYLPGKEEHIHYGFPVLYENSFWSFFVPERDDDWAALDDLLARQWWSRAWVVQEVWSARDAVLQCGHATIPWSMVRLALNYREAWDDIGNQLRLESWEARRKLWPSLKRRYGLAIHIAGQRAMDSTLPNLLWNTWDRNAEDPRDKVFAVLDLVAKEHQIPIQPDYTKPVNRIYAEVACEIAKRSPSLDHVLLAASNRVEPSDLPSWVPDWRREANDSRPTLFVNRHKLYSLYHSNSMVEVVTWGHGYEACGTAKTVVDFDESLRTMRVSAVQFDQVLRCTGTFHEAITKDDDGLEDYVRLASQIIGIAVPPEDTDRLPRIKTVLAAGSPGEQLEYDFHAASAILPKRKFFITEQNRLAIGPGLTEKGDSVVIIAGCNYPMVLRRNGNGTFQLIGESFVEGVMEEVSVVAVDSYHLSLSVFPPNDKGPVLGLEPIPGSDTFSSLRVYNSPPSKGDPTTRWDNFEFNDRAYLIQDLRGSWVWALNDDRARTQWYNGTGKPSAADYQEVVVASGSTLS